jgi:tetratricopeptide (TPR) repeat protein
MKTIDFSYFIERYNAGEMNETEKQWFRKELETNEKLREETNLRAKTDRVLADYNSLLLRNKLRAIENQRAEAMRAAPKRRHVAIRYAAAIAGLMMLGSVFFFHDRELTPEEILDKYKTTFESATASRSGEVIADPDYLAAMEYYDVRNFREAAILFSKIIEGDPGDMNVMMLYGVSNYEEKNYPVARESFKTVVDDSQNLFIEAAEWYLALCHIQTNETDKAISGLQKIASSESSYKKQARKLLRDLK